MYPYLFGFIETYVVLILIGVLLAFLVAVLFLKKRGFKRNAIIDMLICAVVAVASGVVAAVLFQNVYEMIKYGSEYHWSWHMTFYGGLFGGVAGFLLTYRFYYLKHSPDMIRELLKIAPASITIAHGVGRIGCFMAGCCYGKETDSWIGVTFPGHSHAVIPTQLIEAACLFVLFVILLLLVTKWKRWEAFPIYMVGYGIARFIIEFFRGDDRGAYIGPFSPSQFWCIILLVAAVPTYLLFKKFFFNGKQIA